MGTFRETDDIIRLGKWAFLKIPTGKKCMGCHVLGTVGSRRPNKIGYYCDILPNIALTFDASGPFKDDRCPAK